jgi:hypothetical protein
MISPNSPTSTYYPQPQGSSTESKSIQPANTTAQAPSTAQKPQLDAESKLKRGWNEGVKENQANKSMTYAMGVGCLLMNLIPGLRMKWGTAIKMAVANMGLMAVINQGFGMMKGYQGKSN